jgi:hypothetical protein
MGQRAHVPQKGSESRPVCRHTVCLEAVCIEAAERKGCYHTIHIPSQLGACGPESGTINHIQVCGDQC